ncbi:MAG: DUF3667 domain-containing protein [Sphingomonas sp.]|nr:DUF3667 domain-containing protein [Sphingomonas sp.]
MSGIEGVGDAVTGGMLARTAEPEAGEHAEEGDGTCLNCGAELTGPYCRMCGQKAHLHRTISAIGHDLIHGILHLDGKFWRTLPLLAWRPGDLTRRYVHGERARFVSPLGMFLFAIFLMFAVLQIYGLSLSNLGAGLTNTGQSLEIASNAINSDLTEARERRGELAAALASGARPERNERRRERIARLDERIVQLEESRQSLERVRSDGGFSAVNLNMATTGWKRLDKGLQKVNENPSLALYKLQTNGYKFSWLLIPMSVPFVWALFFWTRRFRFYDHTVFVTYSLAFMSLLAVVLTVLGFAGVHVAIIGTAGVFIPPIHMYRQLKQAYELGWFGALVRTVLLVNFCFYIAGFFFVLLLGIGALG